MAGQFIQHRDKDGLAREILRLSPRVESLLVRRGSSREDAEDFVSRACAYLLACGCEFADILPLLTRKALWIARDEHQRRTLPTVPLIDTHSVPVFQLPEPALTHKLWHGGLRETPLAVADLLSSGVNKYQSRLILRYGWRRELKIFSEIGEVLNRLH